MRTHYGGALRFAGTASGIYSMFLLYGVVHENLYKLSDERNYRHKFHYGLCLTAVVAVGNALFALIGLFLTHPRTGVKVESRVIDNEYPFMRFFTSFFNAVVPRSAIPAVRGHRAVNNRIVKEYALMALTYVVSMACTNYSLNHVNYPTLIVVKSAKLVPVVVGGYLFFGKKYRFPEYLNVAVVTLSLIFFNYENLVSPKMQTTTTRLGLVLLMISLVCDGTTGPRQDNFMANYPEYREASTMFLMFLTNVFASFIAVGLSVALEGMAPWSFVWRNLWTAGPLLAGLGTTAALGQMFIFASLQHYGALFTSMLTTMRKATSTVLSIWLHNHQLQTGQWIALLCMFTSLSLSNALARPKIKRA